MTAFEPFVPGCRTLPCASRQGLDAFKALVRASARFTLHDFQFQPAAAPTRLANAGCALPEIAAITGHSLRSIHIILKQYLKHASARPAPPCASFRLIDREGIAQ